MTTEISTEEARQGETPGRMRYVLAGSLALAVASLAFVAWATLA